MPTQWTAAIQNLMAGFVYTPPEPDPEVVFDVPGEWEATVEPALDLLGAHHLLHPDVMSRGNMKIAKNTLIFNLPPVKTCPNNASCKATCYAVPSYRLRYGVRRKYDSNYKLAKENIEELAGLIVRQLEVEDCEIVRLHSSGDFFSQAYVDMWTAIAEAFPKIRFYTYTKADKILDFSNIDALKNFNLIRSMIDGHLNYGSEEYLARMKKKYPKAYICPATRGKDVHCGKECKYCVTGNMPLFKLHGTNRKAGPLPEQKYY